jgi:hypothetical protein
MRQYRLDADVDRRDVVDARRHPRTDHQLDDDTGGRRVGADVRERRDPQRENPAVRIERELGLARYVAPVTCTENSPSGRR